MEYLRGKTVTIVGLGLMGGSLALALRPAGVHLVGVEADPQTGKAALARGVVDRLAPSPAAGAAGADLVVLATPVRTILAQIAALAGAESTGYTLLDLGSTKGEICAALERLPAGIAAIGGHPMCGKETAGLDAADPALYRDATFILCRTGRTTAAAEQLARAVVAAAGARPLILSPDTHDRLVALVSHLPYFVAATLMAEAAAGAAESEHVWPVSASGFRDSARLAGSDPQMMRDIALSNRPAILARLDAYRERLDEVIALLEQGTDAELTSWLAARQREHRQYSKEK